MKFNTNSDQAYISSNPFAAKENRDATKIQQPAKAGKRPRILKPVYSVRLG